MNKSKNNRGITLIALIVMVVILLILTAVTFDIIIDGDFFAKAEGTVGQANSQIHNQEQQADEIESVWDAIPGKVIKSETQEQTTLLNKAPTVRVTTSAGETTATITAIGNDSDGDTLKYALTVKNQSGTSVLVNYELNEQNEWTVSGLTANTTYVYIVIVSDGTSTTTSSGTFKTIIDNSVPVIEYNYDYKETTNAKTTSKFTIAMSATDVDGDTLIFELLVSTSETGTYYSVGTTTASSGETKTIAVTTINGASLTEYTEYWWKVKVTDGNGGEVTSSPLSLYTYCSGESLATASLIQNSGYCDSCNGTGNDCGGSTYGEYYDVVCSCGNTFSAYAVYCDSCGFTDYHTWTCSECGEHYAGTYENHPWCTSCNGSGGYDDSYYYCSTCGYKSYSQSEHTCYCSHGESEQHDS